MLKLSKGISSQPIFRTVISMRFARAFLVFSFSILLLPVLSPSQTPPLPQTDIFFSVPPSDAPELAPRGPYAVGVRTIEIKNPSQIDILNFDKATGKAPIYDRPLPLEIWYPATIPHGKEERAVYEMALPGEAPASGVPKTFAVLGKGLRGCCDRSHRFGDRRRETVPKHAVEPRQRSTVYHWRGGRNGEAFRSFSQRCRGRFASRDRRIFDGRLRRARERRS